MMCYVTVVTCLFIIQKNKRKEKKNVQVQIHHNIKTIARLISIYFYLDKINSCYYLYIMSLPKQHVINSFLNKHHSEKAVSYYIAITYLMSK